MIRDEPRTVFDSRRRRREGTTLVCKELEEDPSERKVRTSAEREDDVPRRDGRTLGQSRFQRPTTTPDFDRNKNKSFENHR